MAEARIHARQRAFADFRQHAHPNRGFLISRGVRYTVGVAAGEKIHGALCRVHRHVQFLSSHPVGHQSADANLTVTRDELHPGSALDAALFRGFGRDLDEGIRDLLTDSVDAISKVPS